MILLLVCGAIIILVGIIGAGTEVLTDGVGIPIGTHIIITLLLAGVGITGAGTMVLTDGVGIEAIIIGVGIIDLTTDILEIQLLVEE